MFKKIMLGLGLAGLMAAVTASAAVAQSVTQGYEAGEQLQNGMVVQLEPGSEKEVGKSTAKVVPLKKENELVMLGVVVSSNESPISLSDPDKQQVFVARAGQYAVLVSTESGAIKAGDYLSISSLKGVAMKATGKNQVVLGKALQNFSDGANASGRVTIGEANARAQVAIGRILVDVGIARNPAYSGDLVAGVPSVLSRAARAVTDKPITALRLYACMAILFVALSVAGGILFAGARSGMMAVGRNPLAKKSIFKSMITVVLMAIIVVTVGVIGVFLLLRM